MIRLEDWFIKYKFVFMSIILLIFIIIMTVQHQAEINEYEKMISNRDTVIYELEEQLSETELSVINLQNMKVELEDDIKSMELQINDMIEENDYLSVRCVELENKDDTVLESLLDDNQKFLYEYLKEGGTIADIGEWKCTAYCTERRKHICGTGSGITSSGEPVQANVSVAVNKANLEWLPYGTKIYIEDVGVRVIQDTGGGVAKNQFDCANGTHEEALAWSGAGVHRVWKLN